MIEHPYSGGPVDRYFIDCCRTKLLKEYLPKIGQCLEQLSEEDLWWRAHETNNSIGNLMLHLAGNVRQWVCHHLGGRDFRRQRDAEFLQREMIPKRELLERLTEVLKEADEVLRELPAERLLSVYEIQTYRVTGLEAVLHITEHFSYHVGQIAYITKLRSGKDLGFYHF